MSRRNTTTPPPARHTGHGAQPRRTGIFGGSFNPIHTGHISLALQLLERARLDEIWFIVSPLNPFKQSAGDLLDDDLRLQLTRRALAPHPRLTASDYEFRLPKPSYMWVTLSHLSADYPDRTFVPIIGADNWLAFDRWANPQYILQHYEPVVYPRRGFPVDAASLPPGVSLVDTPLYDISSTEIRRRVAHGEPIDAWVPPEIVDAVTVYYRHHDTPAPDKASGDKTGNSQ